MLHQVVHTGRKVLRKSPGVLKRVLAATLAFLLIVEVPLLYAYDPRAQAGINAAVRGLANATSIHEALSGMSTGASGNCTVNVPGLANPMSVPLCSEAQNFRQQMQGTVSNWMNGGQSPSEIGQNMANDYIGSPPTNFTENMTAAERADAGAQRASQSFYRSEVNRPYGPEAYAYSRELWQPYIDLWVENGTAPYVADLTQDLSCNETVYVNCENRTATRCYEDACFGYQYSDMAACQLYYDANGTFHDDCASYEGSGCILVGERCLSSGYECAPLPCYPNCSITASNGTVMQGCCVAERDYVCIRCNGGTPVPNLSPCPTQTTHNGICNACLKATTNPRLPPINVSGGDASHCPSTAAYQEGGPAHICGNIPYCTSVSAEVWIGGSTATITFNLNAEQLAAIQGGTVQLIYYTETSGACNSFDDDQDVALYFNGVRVYYADNHNSEGCCGCRHVSGALNTSLLRVGTNTIRLDATGAGGGEWSGSNAGCRRFWIRIVYDPSHACPAGYIYDPSDNTCKYYEPGTILESGRVKDRSCDRFDNDTNCTLISTQCVRDANGTPVTDDLGNCFLYEYRYRCCEPLGSYRECRSSSRLDCSGISCIGYQCRPEETDNSNNGNFTDVIDISWLMDQAPFAKGEGYECEEKKWLAWSVDCCDLDVGDLSPLAYFELAQGGYYLYRHMKKFLERGYRSLTAHWSQAQIAGFYDQVNQACYDSSTGIEEFLNIATTPQQSTTVQEPLTGGHLYSLLPSPLQQVVQKGMYGLDIASYILNPSPRNIIRGIFTDPNIYKLVSAALGRQVENTAGRTLGQAAADKLAEFFGSDITGSLSTALSYISIALTTWEVLNIIAQLILGGCSEDDLELMAKKKMGLCHYVGSYSEGGGLLSKSSKFKVYCCFNSPIARKLTEMARNSWGTPEHPDCSGIRIDELRNIDWRQADWSELQYYRQQTSPTTQDAIVQQGQQGGYGIRYRATGQTYNGTPVLRQDWATLDDVGHRAADKMQLLQQNGAFQTN